MMYVDFGCLFFHFIPRIFLLIVSLVLSFRQHFSIKDFMDKKGLLMGEEEKFFELTRKFWN